MMTSYFFPSGPSITAPAWAAIKILWWNENDPATVYEKVILANELTRQGRHSYLTTELTGLAPGASYQYRTEIYDANQTLVWSVTADNPSLAANMNFTTTQSRSIADELAIDFDVNNDDQVNSEDFVLINQEQQTNPSAPVFANWTNITTWIQMFLDAQGATAKLEVLKSLWGIRRDSLNPILKKSIFGFLAQQTLIYSSQPGATTTGIFNVPIAEMLVALKEDEQNHAPVWYPQIRNYILGNVQQFAPFAQQKVLALWDNHKVLVNYSALSFFPGAGADTFGLHLNYLDGMKNLLDGNAPPFIKKAIDMVEIRNGMMKGSGYGVHVVTTHYEPFGSIGNFAHEAFHIAMASAPLNFLGSLAPPIWGTFVSEAGSNPANFVSFYAQIGGVHENLAEVGTALTQDTVYWFDYAAKRAVTGNSLPPGSGYGILLEQFISLLSLPIFPQHPDKIETTLMDAQGNIQHGSFPIVRGANGQITKITVLGQSYVITYKPNGRIDTVVFGPGGIDRASAGAQDEPPPGPPVQQSIPAPSNVSGDAGAGNSQSHLQSQNSEELEQNGVSGNTVNLSSPDRSTATTQQGNVTNGPGLSMAQLLSQITEMSALEIGDALQGRTPAEIEQLLNQIEDMTLLAQLATDPHLKEMVAARMLQLQKQNDESGKKLQQAEMVALTQEENDRRLAQARDQQPAQDEQSEAPPPPTGGNE